MESSNSGVTAPKTATSRNELKPSAPPPPDPSRKPYFLSVNGINGKPTPPPLPLKGPLVKLSIAGTTTVGRNPTCQQQSKINAITAATSKVSGRICQLNGGERITNVAPSVSPPGDPPTVSRTKPHAHVQVIKILYEYKNLW